MKWIKLSMPMKRSKILITIVLNIFRQNVFDFDVLKNN